MTDTTGTRKSIVRLTSRLGDVILQGDTIDRDGNVVTREVVMFVPTAEVPDEVIFDG